MWAVLLRVLISSIKPAYCATVLYLYIHICMDDSSFDSSQDGLVVNPQRYTANIF